MATFAPVYRPSKSKQSTLAHEHARERKRKRVSDHRPDQDDRSSTASSVSEPEKGPRIPHPVNWTDPYYVAGHPREDPLPGGNFPHAAASAPKKEERPLEEELSSLKPPLYLPNTLLTRSTSSLKRRHLDNLTAILHRCMSIGDWQRASRAWGILLRTEIDGQGIDIRQHGRWMIGAELLMRRNYASHIATPTTEQEDIVPVIADEGFRRAREYYERLALQFPHVPRAHHSSINALVIYPVLFNIWVVEVQTRADRARDVVWPASPTSSARHSSPAASMGSEHERTMEDIGRRELTEALAITHRLDEILQSPPYDTNTTLLELKGMLALWLSDLYRHLAGTRSGSSNSSDQGSSLLDHGDGVGTKAYQERGEEERDKAREVFENLLDMGVKLPSQYVAFMEQEGNASDVSQGDVSDS